MRFLASSTGSLLLWVSSTVFLAVTTRETRVTPRVHTTSTAVCAYTFVTPLPRVIVLAITRLRVIGPASETAVADTLR